MHLTPNGSMRMNATRHAHEALSQKRVDITKELEDISKELEKRNAQSYALEQKQRMGKVL